MPQGHLCSLCLLILYLTTGYGQESKFSGPLKPMTFSIFEGQESSQIIFQFKVNPPAVNFALTGETDNIFKIEPNGLLYLTKALDRETRSIHNLQVAALDANGAIVEGPVPITIEVKDINDNRPMFLQSKYESSVRQNSRPGKPFMYVNATDLDDPATPNGQLFYEIVIQLPKINNVMYFQINNKTGAISLTREGAQELDPIKNPSYSLVVSVKDMGGENENSFSDTTSVHIMVTENIWKAPGPVEIVENSTEPHPIKVTQVRWNDLGARYSLVDKEKLPRFPFSIDQEGDIYVTQPLDREEKDSYNFYAVAKDEQGQLLAKPLEIHVKVKDINDNPPTCPSAVTVFEVQEKEPLGNSIGSFTAYDKDEKNTANSILFHRIVEQTPHIPEDGLFLVEAYTGKFQLAKRSLKKQDTSQYNLTVEVYDKDFHTFCAVQINVIDINDQIPIFEKSDYGNLTIPEDTNIGSTILTIQATDNDEPLTGSSKILYRITEGDNEGRLGVDTDPHTNAGYVIVKRPLDFETAAVSNIVFKAENPEPLVFGVTYNASSYAKFKLIVTDVNEAPIFSQHVFQARVSEAVTIGTKVGNVTAKDPEGLDIRYSLRGDRRGWLKIDPVTGEIFSTAPLDREAENVYQVQVVATEVGGSSLSSMSHFHLTLTDVNDNPPRLVKEYTGLFFCYPLSAPGSLIFEATDDDWQFPRGPQFTFSLGSESLQKDWEVSKINGTHASLSTKHTSFEESIYEVPIRINDGGRPPLEGIVSLPVTVCRCVEERCFQPADRQPGMPTVGMAVGILLTTFLVIGIILAAVFIRIKKDKGKDNVQSAQTSEVEPLRS
ncbi:cadherin-17 isoform X1 [Nycticebus coucang]|uniref:cadherin-17 isoform X1 n=1 Tax=Nycticebus coucang TaxID=9470 RepID=UPI00234CBF3B|nr:cadherin-17 isoform X1 [Nycticebus coucang]XP_053414976.1 cadherin-17 isoform X1 [Nycticebus coucang]XP_053414978.1 cadherin-17 isoform X1 [Nycticebus coucang]XP_053414979.1 cadherin-17 isoform X1 [Nycticebus coucang]XP_053414980.1 cadherin-17 isoform X1 [Nycticebus coucang]XP_053414981.1 cadherin-17 isoform X1 [Nycticebus coucang]